MFHVTDEKFERSIQRNGVRRCNRDSLHFMYDNDGSYGYIFEREQEHKHQGNMIPQGIVF